MVCEICGKTMFWCLGHPPYRFALSSPVQAPEGEENR